MHAFALVRYHTLGRTVSHGHALVVSNNHSVTLSRGLPHALTKSRTQSRFLLCCRNLTASSVICAYSFLNSISLPVSVSPSLSLFFFLLHVVCSRFVVESLCRESIRLFFIACPRGGSDAQSMIRRCLVLTFEVQSCSTGSIWGRHRHVTQHAKVAPAMYFPFSFLASPVQQVSSRTPQREGLRPTVHGPPLPSTLTQSSTASHFLCLGRAGSFASTYSPVPSTSNRSGWTASKVGQGIFRGEGVRALHVTGSVRCLLVRTRFSEQSCPHQ